MQKWQQNCETREQKKSWCQYNQMQGAREQGSPHYA
jgi:hypothetical protein